MNTHVETEATILDHHRGLDGLREEDVLQDREVSHVLLSVIPTVVTVAYSEEQVADWLAAITDGCLRSLAALRRPYKYVVSCHISQKAGAGLHSAVASRCNPSTDGAVSVVWHSDTVTATTTAIFSAI